MYLFDVFVEYCKDLRFSNRNAPSRTQRGFPLAPFLCGILLSSDTIDNVSVWTELSQLLMHIQNFAGSSSSLGAVSKVNLGAPQNR